MMKRLILFLSVVLLLAPSCDQKQKVVQEAPDFTALSQQIWDLMAAKDADALQDIFHPNAMFVHMGGYWDSAQELETIRQGWLHYKHAEVYNVDVKQINENNWAVYSTIKLDAALGGSDNVVTTPFFVTQTFTREEGKWWMTAIVFTTRTAGPGIDPYAPADIS